MPHGVAAMKTTVKALFIAVAVPSETSIAYHRQRPDDVMLLEAMN
jgi:hypothetical protein